MSDSMLDRLCARLGIDRAYEDAWGRRTEVPDEIRRALAAAMGHPATGEAEAQAHLEALLAADAACILPPAVVLFRGAGPLALALGLPLRLRECTLHWRILLEDGGERDGTTEPRLAAEGASQPADAILRATCLLPDDIPPGHHRLRLFEPGEPPQEFAAARLVVCPPRCFAPDDMDGGAQRLWGPAVQLYALRSRRNWGIGDFGDLRRLVDAAANAGAHFVGLNPLHALFPHDPERASPYSPSSREWLDVLYLDIETMRDFGECAEARALAESEAFRARLEALRDAPMVDYAGVAAAKFEVLDLLYRHFRAFHLEGDTQRAGLFRDFQREGGRSLRLHALFEALQAHFHARDPAVWGWTVWPEPWRDAGSPAVAAFARSHEAEVEFFEYLQWQAEVQLRAVAMRAEARGMRIGLYRDLAVGVNEGGSETWANRALHALSMHAGAPPDELNPGGQDWGFPPAIPQRMAEQGFEAFVAVLRANMRHAGALRIDHVMSLMRLFWLPAGGRGRTGAYVAYPFDPLLGLVCLESRRQRCLVIGEDLGIVPQAIREAMARHAMLSYRPLYFEQDWEQVRFHPPHEWPVQALATVCTHDLPTFAGYWSGDDLQLRDALGMYADRELRERHHGRRDAERHALLRALAQEGLLGDGLTEDPASVGDADRRLATAVHRFIARSPAAMLEVHLEDVFGQREAVNVPGTSEAEYPNWRRKLAVGVDALEDDAGWQAVAAAIGAERASPPRRLSGGPPDFQPHTADIPRATYRLQFHRDFGFAEAEAVLPYLAALGISHVYASPFLKARPGSTHGYDIVDHQAVNPEIGSEAAFEGYCARLSGLGLKQLLDIVPNHMGVLGADNLWWLDVLENGPQAEHADYFDIDWTPSFAELHGKVLLPVLGDQYGRVLEAGELRLQFSSDSGEFSVRYFEHRFPVDPCDYPAILADGGPGAEEEGAVPVELETLLAALRHLPPRDDPDPERQAERRHNKEVFKQHLAELYARLPEVRVRVAARLARFNGRVGVPESFDALDALLGRQAYRLASWRVAADDINYRRFFDINDLAALRMDSPPVFEATHAQLFAWIEAGHVAGLRIDHPDGLADPTAYFAQLQARYRELCRRRAPDAEPPGLYVVVEKILGEFELLPASWPVHGGTGYRFGSLVNNLFVDSTQESRFTRLYRAFTGESRNFSEVLLEAKHLIMTHSLSGDLGGLTQLLHEIAQHDRRTRDFTRSRLRGALMEIAAAFPVYRSYIGAHGVSEADRRYIDRAVDEASRRALAGDLSVLRFVRKVLLSAPTEPDAALRAMKLRFAQRFQQFTAPVMAKAMEDTAFYRYNRLVSLNEVGGDPRTFGISVGDFHAANERAAHDHPFGLLGSSTHDSKRSEDVRARIDVLSEMPGPWRLALRRWRRLNVGHKTRVRNELAPSPNDEYLLYQTLLGVWPMQAPDAATLAALEERVGACMLKAAREAKRHTSWMNPDAAYEDALAAFVHALFENVPHNPFLDDFLPFQAVVSRFGACNSLSMQLLKLAAPGVPDIYQGCELWNFCMVDPDNRRPVDFAVRRARLDELQREFADGGDVGARVRTLFEQREDGRIKLYLLWRGLAARRAFERTLRHGRYVDLKAEGPAARHVVAFARTDDRHTVIAVAGRLLYGLCEGEEARLADGSPWARTVIELPRLPEAEGWVDAFGGRTLHTLRDGPRRLLEVATLFATLPVALLLPHTAAKG